MAWCIYTSGRYALQTIWKQRRYSQALSFYEKMDVLHESQVHERQFNRKR